MAIVGSDKLWDIHRIAQWDIIAVNKITKIKL
jgi:hypothetical protein